MFRLVNKKPERAGMPSSTRYTSSMPRPYRFHIGASWAGKPPEPGPKRPHVPFPSDSVIGAWRDKTLSRPKAVPSKDAGEDFFHVQEVSL
jgi:protein phosphatase PTC7